LWAEWCRAVPKRPSIVISSSHCFNRLIDQQSRRTDFVAANPFQARDSLNRVADRAGHALFVEGPIQLGIFGERARNKRDRVMTAFAMACGLDAVLLDERLDVLLIEGLAEAVAMGRLLPLRVRVRMTARAV